MEKKLARIRRAIRTRRKQKKLCAIRLVVHRTPRHMYAQIIETQSAKVLTTASTLEKKKFEKLHKTGNKNAAEKVGKVIAERALKKGIKNVSFDRSGFKYHGRVKILADAARKAGLHF